MIVANETKVFIALDSDMLETKIPFLVKKFQLYNVNVEIVPMGEHSDP
jgi:hypothetical protein